MTKRRLRLYRMLILRSLVIVCMDVFFWAEYLSVFRVCVCVCLYVMSGKLCLDFPSFFSCLGKCGCNYVWFIEGVFLRVFSYLLWLRGKIFTIFFSTFFFISLYIEIFDQAFFFSFFLFFSFALITEIFFGPAHFSFFIFNLPWLCTKFFTQHTLFFDFLFLLLFRFDYVRNFWTSTLYFSISNFYFDLRREIFCPSTLYFFFSFILLWLLREKFWPSTLYSFFLL